MTHAFDQVFDNIDILRIVYSFGDPSHRENLRNVHEEMEEGNALSPIPRDGPFQESFHLFNMLKRCRCCSRHSHRKPTIKRVKTVLFFYRDYGERVPEDRDMYNCHCACRHQSRHIHRYIQRKLLCLSYNYGTQEFWCPN